MCPSCVVDRRLTAILGDESTRARNGLGPLFEALTGSSTPKAVLDWLTKSRKAVDALSSIGKGESSLSYETMDDLEAVLGVHTARHLESLLTATGALPARDLVLAATERWCARLLATIDHEEHSKVLRAWVRWQVLHPLRDKATLGPLLDSTGHGTRSRLQNVVAFCSFLAGRGRSLGTCRQADVDAWASSQHRNRVSSLAGFTSWASRRSEGLDLRLGRLRRGSRAAGERWPAPAVLLERP